jgi:hypothetical protein
MNSRGGTPVIIAVDLDGIHEKLEATHRDGGHVRPHEMTDSELARALAAARDGTERHAALLAEQDERRRIRAAVRGYDPALALLAHHADADMTMADDAEGNSNKNTEDRMSPG